MARKTTLILTLIIALTMATTALGANSGGRAPDERTAADASARDQKLRPVSSTSEPSTSTSVATTNLDSEAAAPTSPSDQDLGADEGVPRGEPVHEVLPGAGGPPPAGSTDPIGELDDDGPVPAGLDIVAPPAEGGDPSDVVGPDDLAVAPSCSHQCITSGVAYARGFGAELVVETSVPASLFMTAIADVDGDGNYEEVHVESTPFGLTSHSWALDHLEPGQTYHVMATATDENDHTAYVWGEFTTLSQRDVFVELGSADIYGGPGGIVSTTWKLGLDGPLTDVTPGQQGILLYNGLPRFVDLGFWMFRYWDDDLCESWDSDQASPQGHWSDACVAWNSAIVDDLDLDIVPGDQAHWTQTAVHLTLHPPSGAGDALPPGYGDPNYFHFEIPVTLHVTYS